MSDNKEVEYHLVFKYKNQDYSVVYKNKGILTKDTAELFAWGVIRSVLSEKGLPLEGCAKDIVVMTFPEHDCVWQRKCIDIPAADEII